MLYGSQKWTKDTKFQEIEFWDIRWPILIDNPQYKNTYPIRIHSDTYGPYIELTVERKLYHYLRRNFKFKNLDLEELINEWIVVKKRKTIILCNKTISCDKCKHYDKCSYCVIKQLSNKNIWVGDNE